MSKEKKPMTVTEAAVKIEKILAQLPEADRLRVLQFVAGASQP